MMKCGLRNAKCEKRPSVVVRISYFVLLLGVAILTACRPDPAPPPPPITPPPLPETLRIGLATSATAVADLILSPYQQTTDPADIQFIIANSATLFDDLASGALDALLVHYIPANDTNWFNPIALDGLAFIVHPDNPLDGLSSNDSAALYGGQFADWAALGGLDQSVTLFSRERGSGTGAIFTQRIMVAQPLSVNTRIQPDDGSMTTAVAADPYAIGYTMMGNAPANVKILTLDGLLPTPTTTADQTYPLTTPLYFVSPQEPTGQLRAFLAFLQSDAGQAILGQQYGRVR